MRENDVERELTGTKANGEREKENDGKKTKKIIKISEERVNEK